MSPAQALQLLDQACSQISLNREGHGQLQQALSTMRQLIEANKVKEEVKEDVKKDPKK